MNRRAFLLAAGAALAAPPLAKAEPVGVHVDGFHPIAWGHGVEPPAWDWSGDWSAPGDYLPPKPFLVLYDRAAGQVWVRWPKIKGRHNDEVRLAP